MSLSTQVIESIVNRYRPERRIYIAYSGGIDSHVLLHLFAAINDYKNKLTAVYVHHGLQPEAESWAGHCASTAGILGVDFISLQVNASAKRGESPEEAARNARYSAFKSLLDDGDVLVVAQHQNDQLETVLLQLFRGAGLQGLAGMAECSAFGRGMLLRPMLQFPKAAINHYAHIHGLNWVDDPSNQHNDFDRNFLRNDIIPRLMQRWPGINKTISRSARHCAEAQHLIGEWAHGLFQPLFDPDNRTLDIAGLAILTAQQQKWVIRRWFQVLGLKPPSEAVLKAVVGQMLNARNDAEPTVLNQGYLIKRYRQKLFCVAAGALIKEPIELSWPLQADSLPMASGYCITRVDSSSGISKKLWQTSEVTVRSRQGKEKIKPAGRSGRHELKKLYQESGIPPWEREIRPLIYLNGRLAAVAGLWIDEWAWAQNVDNCYRLQWLPIQPVEIAPRIDAYSETPG